jgi:hypothetical protein
MHFWLMHSWVFGQPVQLPPQPSEAPPHLPAQLGVQHCPFMHVCPFGQLVQLPPQPSDWPQVFPAQSGMQQWPAMQAPPFAHGPLWHVPPQPSAAPQSLPVQLDWQQLPERHGTPVGQEGLHTQVSMQVPLRQICPLLQTTPAHGFWMQVGWPFASRMQSEPAGHIAVAQGSGGWQVIVHAKPDGHVAEHGIRSRQVPSWQYLPIGQVTPLQGTMKQPIRQWPLTHVCPVGQLMPAHRSPVGTQVAPHVSPVGQPANVAHGSGLHVPPRHTRPVGHAVAGSQ